MQVCRSDLKLTLKVLYTVYETKFHRQRWALGLSLHNNAPLTSSKKISGSANSSREKYRNSNYPVFVQIDRYKILSSHHMV